MLRSLLAGARGRWLQLFKSPGVVHRVITLLGRGKAHIGPYPRHVRWLNMTGDKAINDRQVACVACRILREDPLAGVRAESIDAPVVRNLPRGCTDRRATQRQLADV